MSRERPLDDVGRLQIGEREGLVDGSGPTRARLVTLKRRQDFLRVRDGARWGSQSLTVEAKVRSLAPPDVQARVGWRGAAIDGPRFGFTVTKKIGSAVVRNRVRRRLKDAVRRTLADDGFGDVDFVLIARPAAVGRPFEELLNEVRTAVSRTSSGVRDGRTSSRRSKGRRQHDGPAGSTGTGRE